MQCQSNIAFKRNKQNVHKTPFPLLLLMTLFLAGLVEPFAIPKCS